MAEGRDYEQLAHAQKNKKAEGMVTLESREEESLQDVY